MFFIEPSNKFRKDLERARKRGKKLQKLEAIIELLRTDSPLDKKHRLHLLSGNWAGFWELHVEPDWLLIYEIDGDTLYLVRTGSHSDLF